MSEAFPDIPKINFEGPKSKNPLAFKHYNADEVVAGKKMRDHMRFGVAYWHAMRNTLADPFGSGTSQKPWDDGTNSVENAVKRTHVCFEFMEKLGVDYYCFHDRDIAPECDSLAESNKALDRVVDELELLQKQTGKKLLWGTACLFAHPRYNQGASTSPNANVFAYAAAQVKKALEVTHRLGGEGYTFWGGREGYASLWNTNLKREMDHLAAFLHMAVAHKKKIGFKGPFYIEPKPREPSTHQYDSDSAACLNFLREYGLLEHFKLNIETNHATLAGHTFQHEIEVAGAAGMLGSIDANAGDPLLGWDTDQFNTDVKELTLAMVSILKAGGLGSGGFNFDAKLRRPSTDMDDLFHAHIGGMDAYALSFKLARQMLADGKFEEFVANRYASFDSGFGKEIETKKTNFRELEKIALKLGKPTPKSGKQEYLENLLLSYLYS